MKIIQKQKRVSKKKTILKYNIKNSSSEKKRHFYKNSSLKKDSIEKREAQNY